MTISSSVTETSKEEHVSLERVLYIHYLLHFRKDTAGVKAIIDSGRDVDAMIPAYPSKLDLKVHHTNVEAQKIDGSTLKIFGMVLANLQVEDKLGRVWVFQETFLLADISAKVVSDMPFLTLSNADVQFIEKELTWRSYITAEALPTTKRVKLINKKEFAKAALDKKSETFVVHMASLNLAPQIHPDKTALIASLLIKQVKIPNKYLDFANVFLEEKALVLLERTEFNQHVIKLEEGKQPPYGPTFSLGPVKLETLKTYIETHLKTGFIRPFKSLTGTPILFDQKPNGNFCLCVDYQGLNNLTIKNRYPLPWIRESLD